MVPAASASAATLDEEPVEIATGTLAAAPERRVVRVNGATTTANALAEWLSVLWLTPAMDRLFVEPASETPPLSRSPDAGAVARARRGDDALRGRNARAQ